MGFPNASEQWSLFSLAALDNINLRAPFCCTAQGYSHYLNGHFEKNGASLQPKNSIKLTNFFDQQDKDKLWKGKESSHNTKSFQGQRVNWPSNTISEARDIASEAHQRKRKTQGNWQEKESRTEPCSIKRWQNQSITHLKKIWQYLNS